MGAKGRGGEAAREAREAARRAREFAELFERYAELLGRGEAQGPDAEEAYFEALGRLRAAREAVGASRDAVAHENGWGRDGCAGGEPAGRRRRG